MKMIGRAQLADLPIISITVICTVQSRHDMNYSARQARYLRDDPSFIDWRH